MDLIIKLFDVLFPVFLIIGIGYWYGKKDPKFDTKFITTFAGNFGLPAIIFYSLTTTNISIELFLRFSYYITLYVLIQHFKFLFYKRKSKVKFKIFYTKVLIKKISSLFYKQLFILKSNLIVFNIKLLNKQIKKVTLKLLVNNFKKFKNVLFIRRFNFFIDFLKMTALFLKAAIPLNTYVLFLGQIFKYLTKRHHNRYISFLKYLFQTLLTFFKNKSYLNPILGVKCLLKGRLRGKDRASSSIIKVGVIPTQSLGKKIFFHKIHIYTVYGVYGFKVWLYRL